MPWSGASCASVARSYGCKLRCLKQETRCLHAEHLAGGSKRSRYMCLEQVPEWQAAIV